MKLASLKGGRDGRLVVVSSDGAWYADAGAVAPTLQAALDGWERLEPDLRNLATDLDHEVIPRERFHEREAAAPLPRAYEWVVGAAMADGVGHEPLLYRGGSDAFLGPRDPILLGDAAWELDVGANVVVVTGDVPMGATRDQALAAVRLVGLANDVSLGKPNSGEAAQGFGLFQSKPASAFSPLFVTPDSLGESWRDGKLRRRVMVDVNGQPFGRVEAGDVTFDFGILIAHAAKTRSLGAGTMIGSGSLSDRGKGKPIAAGEASTPFLQPGDTVRIWVEDDRHHSIFGAIEQQVVAAG